MTLAAIFGCAGHALTSAGAAFFREVSPWGFILFERNIDSPDQVRALVSELRATVERPDAPVLIDQEGGRVARLTPPHWRRYPPGRAYGQIVGAETRREITWLGARLMAQDLFELGINVDCAPVLDVPAPGGHEIIGDRAYGDTPEIVAELGRAAAEGLMAGGVLPIVKHIPGHGRAAADSHLDLPVVSASLTDLEARDFAPFKALADLPMAMTAHVVYAAVDPDLPATTSSAVIERVIRGAIGFDGLLISDDLSMKALSGDFEARARDALHAGCDIVLHCNGDPDAEMTSVAQGRAASRRRGRPAGHRGAHERGRRSSALRRGPGARAVRRRFWRAVRRMTLAFENPAEFSAAAEASLDGEALIVDLDGYEGPLDVLLALARGQKVDLLKLSVTRLADQYLAFVREARRRRFAVAADYLVMAAWLAYLKSRLLLPKPAQAAGDEPAAEDLAAQLAFRLAKLDSIRRASEALNTRAILGRDVFARGDPEAITIVSNRPLEGDLYGLMTAYVQQRRRDQDRRYRPSPPKAYGLEEARDRLRGSCAEA